MTDNYFEPPIEINHANNCKASVIWLHGLGADGNDFVPVVKMLNLTDVRFILPHAPYRKVTRNNGYEMRAWYDVYGLTTVSREDEIGIRESQAYIESLITQEISRGVPANKIILAGFSQGGAIALQTALRCKQALAGIMALSTYLPLKTSLASEKTTANQAISVFMAHGTHDDVITMETCQASLEALKLNAYQIDWHEYTMAHSVCAQEIEDIRVYLQCRLETAQL